MNIKNYSKEMYDVMDFFERTIGKVAYVGSDFRREEKSLWEKAIYYCDGKTNDLFRVFLCGYTYRKAIEGTCFEQ